MSDPSPWISAKQFQEFWVKNANGAYKATGKQILNNPEIAWNAPVNQGDVVQLAKINSDGNVGEAFHSMYISGYVHDGTNDTYGLTYHTNNTLFKSLIEVCRSHPNEYIL